MSGCLSCDLGLDQRRTHVSRADGRDADPGLDLPDLAQSSVQLSRCGEGGNDGLLIVLGFVALNEERLSCLI